MSITRQRMDFLTRNQGAFSMVREPCGWYVADADFDGLVALYGPYWDPQDAWDRQVELSAAAAAAGYAPRVTVIPVTGITAA